MQPNAELIDLFTLNSVIDISPLTTTPDTLAIDAIGLMLSGGQCGNYDPDVWEKSPQATNKIQRPEDYVLILEGLELIGIFTQTDFVKLAASGSNLSEIRISDVMTREVISLKQSPNQNIFTVRSLMYRHGIHHLPIVDKKDRLIGIITQNSLLQVLEFEKNLSNVQILQDQLEAQKIQLRELREELLQTRLELERRNTCCNEEIRFLSQIETQINFQANVLAHVSDAVIAIDNDDRIVYLNKRAEQLYNIRADECIGRGLKELYQYRWLNEKDKYFAHDALLTKGWWRGENIHIKNNGEAIYVELSVSFLKDNSGKRIGLLALIRDITERKQTEEKLRQSEELFRLLVTHAPVGIFQTNIQGDCVFVNPRWLDIAGISREEALGTGWASAIHPDDREQVFTQWYDTVGKGQEFAMEYRFQTPQGKVTWVFGSAIAIPDGTGKVIGYLGTLTDITERKQVEKKLRRTEALLQEAQRVAKMGSWSWDLTTGETWWSEEFYRFTSLNQDRPIPDIKVINQAIHPADRERVNQIIRTAIEQAIPYETEFRFLRPDSTVGYVFSCGRVDRNTQGRVVRFYGISQDISEYKQVEKALRESKERYRDLAQKLHSITVNAPIYIYELDRNGRIIFANRPCESFSQGQLLGSLLTDLFPQEAFSSIKRIVEEVFRTEKVQEVEYAIPNQQGEIRFYKTQIAPNRVEGKTTTAVLIAIDITERKLAQEKIAEQAELLDVTTDAILLRSLSGEILYYNQGAESMYGWTSEEAIGKVADELLYKEISPELTEALKTVKENKSWQGELHKVTKEGKEVVVSSRWTLVKDKIGNPKSILTVDTDITEKKQLEQQFFRTQRLESLGTLASGIAHDLNNILTPILAVSQLLPLKVSNLDRSSQDMLKMLESSAKRGSNLVKQILSFARGNEARRRVLQVKHLLRDIEQFVKGTFPKSIEIERSLPRELWTVSADPTQLHQVFMNLVVNARDAMPDGGTLSIIAENMFVDESYARMNIEAKVGPYVVVTIADTGAGIPPENIDRIFDPFFTTKEVGKGTGLGLSTVLGITKNHGGFVKISSEVGKGSQFKVYLPSQEGLVYDKEQDPQLLVGKGELILVIDDEAKICEIIKTTLETCNLQVLTAKDGIEGISIYATHKNEISVVLTDMVMPIMDGEITIRTLQRINPLVKIIAISGLASTEALTQAAGVGVQGFLAKPFTAQELLKAVAGVLSEGD